MAFDKSLLSDTTVKAYASRWRSWTRWCAGQTPKVKPNRPEVDAVVEFLGHLSTEGKSPNTINQARCAIARSLASGYWRDKPDNPATVQAARDAVKVATRRSGLAGRRKRKAVPLTADLVPLLESAVDGHTPQGRRDLLMISLARDALLRVSELARVRWQDFQERKDVWTVHVPVAKNDPHGTQQYRNWVSPLTIERLMEVHRHDRGSDSSSTPVMKCSAAHLARRWVDLGRAAGIEGLTSHSARRGMATDLAQAGYTAEQIQRVGRWRSTDTARSYIDESASLLDAVADMYGPGLTSPT